MLPQDRIDPDELRLYELRRRFNLYELACLAHGASPEKVATNITQEERDHMVKIGGKADDVTPNLIGSRIAYTPESILGDEIGGTLKKLYKVFAGGFQLSVGRDEAARVLTALGMRLPFETTRAEADDASTRAAEAMTGGRLRWTPERLGELRRCKDTMGTSAAAERFGISASRVRTLLKSPQVSVPPTANDPFPRRKT